MERMKNWDHASSAAFEEDPKDVQECYIEDIMGASRRGEQIVFGVVNGQGYMWILGEGEKPGLQLVELPETSETKSCYWCTNPEVINKEANYKWKLSGTGPVLIWWDRDLGDVVVDRINSEESLGCVPSGEWNFDIFEKVTEQVYFYWIT